MAMKSFMSFIFAPILNAIKLQDGAVLNAYKKEFITINKHAISHIMNKKEILKKLSDEYIIFMDSFSNKQKIGLSGLLQKMLIECQNLEQSLIDYKKYIENKIQFLTTNEAQASFEQYLVDLRANNFEQLNDGKINQLLNLNLQKFNLGNLQLQKPLNIIKQHFQQIEQMIQDHQDNQIYHDNQIVDLRNKKYDILEIEQANSYIFASSISHDEKYLAYGGAEKTLKIYDLKFKKISKEIKVKDQIIVCQFTQDSQFLYVGIYDGSVCGYSVANDFQETLNHKIHEKFVWNLIIVSNECLITSATNIIIKTNIKIQQEIFKLNAHTGLIIALDYNNKHDLLLSGSDDLSIKLWNCNNQSVIINKENAHNNGIRQVQFTNNYCYILSLDLDGNVYEWKIDLKQKDLFKVEQYSDVYKIFSFYQFNQDQDLLLGIMKQKP